MNVAHQADAASICGRAVVGLYAVKAEEYVNAVTQLTLANGSAPTFPHSDLRRISLVGE
jgi:hypothetical protein